MEQSTPAQEPIDEQGFDFGTIICEGYRAIDRRDPLSILPMTVPTWQWRVDGRDPDELRARLRKEAGKLERRDPFAPARRR